MKATGILATVGCATVVLLGGLAGTAVAVTGPANDHIGNATVVSSLPFTQTLDTTGATTDAKDAQVNGTCGAPVTNNSVWYKFTAGPTDTVLFVDTTGSDFSSGVIIATGTPGALTTEACAPVSTLVATTPGTTYYILAFDDTGSGGTLQISIHGPGPVPANDKFGNATVVSALPFTQTLDTTGATTDAVDRQANATCGAPSVDHSVWYKYTAGATDTDVLFDASTSNFFAGVLVATGTKGSLTTVTCGPFSATTTVTPGTTYYIAAFDAGGGPGGTLNLTIDRAPTITTTVLYKTQVNASGLAHLKGTYSCTNGGVSPVWDISGQLVEIVGSNVITGNFDAGISTPNCNGSSHPWSATAFPDAGKFAPGKAAAFTSAVLCGDLTCTESSQAVVVKLVHAAAGSSAPGPVTSSSTRTYLRSSQRTYGTALHSRAATWGH